MYVPYWPASFSLLLFTVLKFRFIILGYILHFPTYALHVSINISNKINEVIEYIVNHEKLLTQNINR